MTEEETFFLDLAEFLKSQMLLLSLVVLQKHKTDAFQHEYQHITLCKLCQVFIGLALGLYTVQTNKIVCAIPLRSYDQHLNA